MKNSRQHTQKLKKLFTALKKGTGKSKKPLFSDFIESLVFAVLCEKSSESCAKAAIKKILSHFVDFNDLRVARIEEISEVIGADIEEPEKCALRLTTLLNAIFQKYDCLSPEDLLNAGKKNTQETLAKLNGMSAFVCDYILLAVLNSHAIPITEKMIQYLKTYGVLDAEADDAQITSFIERQITAANGYTFYSLIRHDSELANPKATQILGDDKSKPAAQKKSKPKK
jgi:endonuclease III